MFDLIAAFPGAALAHWAAFALAAYLGIGFRLGLREALATRRQLKGQGVDDSLWPTLALLTCLWPMLFAARFVFWLILAWDVLQIRRADKREARDV